jgi:hypothetical protein
LTPLKGHVAMKANEFKLYQSSGSPNSRRVRIFLAEKGIRMPMVPMDLAAKEPTPPMRCVYQNWSDYKARAFPEHDSIYGSFLDLTGRGSTGWANLAKTGAAAFSQ